MSQKIRGILTVYTSARDRNGNCYHAAQYTDTATGARVHFGHIGGSGNMNGLARMLGFEWDQIVYSEQVMGWREWHRLTSDWPYCNGADDKAVAMVKAAIKDARKAARAAAKGKV